MLKFNKCSKSEKIMKIISAAVITLTAAGITANAYVIGPWTPYLESHEYQSHGVLSIESPSRSVCIDTDDIYVNADRIKDMTALFPGLTDGEQFIYVEEEGTYAVLHTDGTLTYIEKITDTKPGQSQGSSQTATSTSSETKYGDYIYKSHGEVVQNSSKSNVTIDADDIIENADRLTVLEEQTQFLREGNRFGYNKADKFYYIESPDGNITRLGSSSSNGQ